MLLLTAFQFNGFTALPVFPTCAFNVSLGHSSQSYSIYSVNVTFLPSVSLTPDSKESCLKIPLFAPVSASDLSFICCHSSIKLFYHK